MTATPPSAARDLAARQCIACGRDTAPMAPEAVADLLPAIPDWSLAADGTEIVRRFAQPDFARGFALVARIAALAEAAGHHPDLGLGWGYVTASLRTHAIQGLHLNDFILAARIDQAFDDQASGDRSPVDRP